MNPVEISVELDEMRIKVTFSSEVSELKDRMKGLIKGIMVIDPNAKECVSWPVVSAKSKEVAQRYHYILPLKTEKAFLALTERLGITCVYI